MAGSLTDRLRHRIAADGPIPVSTFVEAALYDHSEGFYTTRGRAGGRAGHFLTAPEVGPLFGAVVARAVDRWWVEGGRPDPYVVHEWGAGPGTLARAVVAAGPEVLTAGALRWQAIEISGPQRETHPDHPAVVSAASATGEAHLVVANELLDNLPFDLHAHDGQRWVEQRVAVADAGFTLVDHDRDGPAGLDDLVAAPAPGMAVPWQPAARRWLDEALGSVDAGRVVVLDYGATTEELARRTSVVRTHRGHDDSRDWLRDPGSCDITVDVAIDQLQLDRPATRIRTQAEFLGAHGIDELVDEGRRIWEERASIGDLVALRARSRIGEAEALLDPSGMGGFVVLEWEK